MDNGIEPRVASWYQDLVNGQVFQVIAVDEYEALVELQHSDGDIEELSLDEWHGLDLEAADAPDDWTGPLDDAEVDNPDFSDTRSEGERRGLAETCLRESLQTSETPLDDDIIKRHPSDAAGEADAVAGSARDVRRNDARRSGD
jgi:hypothetical protein